MRASDHASDGRSIQHDKISQIQDDAERGRGVPVILVDSSLDTSIARRHAIAAASSRCLVRAGSRASSRTCSCRERGTHDAYGRRRRMSEVSTSKYPDDGRFPTTSVRFSSAC